MSPVYGGLVVEPVAPIATIEPTVTLTPVETVFEELGKYVAHLLVDEAVELYGPGQTP